MLSYKNRTDCTVKFKETEPQVGCENFIGLWKEWDKGFRKAMVVAKRKDGVRFER
jgi:hypothetical protein